MSFVMLWWMPSHAGGIALPQGWDDTIIDRIKDGKSPKLLLAVWNFEGSEKLAGKVDSKLSDMLTTALARTNRFEMVEGAESIKF